MELICYIIILVYHLIFKNIKEHCKHKKKVPIILKQQSDISGGHRNLGIKNHENIKKIKTNFTKISRLLSTKNVMVLAHHRWGCKAVLS